MTTRTRRLAPGDALTLTEAAELAGVHWRTIYRWFDDGHLTRYTGKVNRVRVSRTELERFIAARQA